MKRVLNCPVGSDEIVEGIFVRILIIAVNHVLTIVRALRITNAIAVVVELFTRTAGV